VADLTCCLTFDVDGMSSWIAGGRSNNPSAISRGEFTAVATPRVLELLARYDIRASFCIPGHTACAYPGLVRDIRDGRHEIVHHGWVHENPASLDEVGERAVLQRGFDALERAAGVRPIGYRSPAWDISTRTIDLLIEAGFTYDSSLMGNDFNAYYVRSGDRWSLDAPFQFGQITDLVELPVTWGLDDFPAFEFSPRFSEGYRAPSAVEEIWRGDFDYALRHCDGGIFTLTLHPEVIGRGHRLTMLERLVDHIRAQPGVAFATMGDYATRWKAGISREQWASANPHAAGTHAIRSL
jgi:peptidoglycan/xylan/chitin deacetylase (PgdA/CDA1 family)